MRGYWGRQTAFETRANIEKSFSLLSEFTMAQGSTPAILGTLNTLFGIPQVQEHLASSSSVPNSLGPATSSTLVSTVAAAAGSATPPQPSLPSTSGIAVSLEGKQILCCFRFLGALCHSWPVFSTH